MFRKFSYFLLVFALSFTLCGCSGKFSPPTVDKMKKELNSLASYQCDVKMSVTNNRSTNDYVMKHYYKKAGKYRIEIASPEELKGQVTIYDGSSAYVFHPGIAQYLVTQNFIASMEHYAFAGAFLEHLEQDAGVRYAREKVGDKLYFVMEFDIENGSMYMQKEKIWFDVQELTPWKAEIYDKDGKATVQVYYDNFIMNPKLDDKLFEIPAKR